MNRLNNLREQAEPVVHLPNGKITGPFTPKLLEQIQAAELAADDEMVRLEIIAAAKEKRIGDVVAPEWTRYLTECPFSYIPWGPTARRWEIARPAIDVLIAAHNRQTSEAYETYRVACEQGIANPPNSDQKK